MFQSFLHSVVAKTSLHRYEMKLCHCHHLYDTGVLYMCVQLWTMYCESLAALSFTVTESYVSAHQTVMDFWGRVTPGILQLLSHSKVVCLTDT